MEQSTIYTKKFGFRKLKVEKQYKFVMKSLQSINISVINH